MSSFKSNQEILTSVILAATSMLREFEMIYLTTEGGPGSATSNLPLYVYKTALKTNDYGYANMMSVWLIVIGVIIVYIIRACLKIQNGCLFLLKKATISLKILGIRKVFLRFLPHFAVF